MDNSKASSSSPTVKAPGTASLSTQLRDCEKCGSPYDPMAVHGSDKSYPFTLCPACGAQYIAEKAKQDAARKALDHENAIKRRANRLEQLLSQLVPWRFRDASLADFPDALTKPFRRLSGDGYVLYGPTGTGKTHLACAAMRYFLENTENLEAKGLPMFTTWDYLLLDIRRCFRQQSTESELDVLEPYVGAEFLVLDDIGGSTGFEQSESDFGLRIFTYVIGERLNELRPTVITTNRTRQATENAFGDRVASRLSTFEWIGCGGKDRRVTS